MTIDWKAVAHHQRYLRRLSEQQEIRLKVRLGQEHAKRAALVNALDVLLPQIAVTRDGCCRWCDVVTSDDEHLFDCPYIGALGAVAQAARS